MIFTTAQRMELLILKSVEGSASPQEQATLLRWRQKSAANEQLYQDLVRLWVALPDVSQPAPGPTPGAQTVIARARLRTFPPAVVGSRSWFRPWTGLAAAAVALVAVASVWLWDRDRGGADFGPEQFVTGPNGAATVTLREGLATTGVDVWLTPARRFSISGRVMWPETETVEDITTAPEVASLWRKRVTAAFRTKQPVQFEFTYPTPAGIFNYTTQLVPELDLHRPPSGSTQAARYRHTANLVNPAVPAATILPSGWMTTWKAESYPGVMLVTSLPSAPNVGSSDPSVP